MKESFYYLPNQIPSQVIKYKWRSICLGEPVVCTSYYLTFCLNSQPFSNEKAPTPALGNYSILGILKLVRISPAVHHNHLKPVLPSPISVSKLTFLWMNLHKLLLPNTRCVWPLKMTHRVCGPCILYAVSLYSEWDQIRATKQVKKLANGTRD